MSKPKQPASNAAKADSMQCWECGEELKQFETIQAKDSNPLRYYFNRFDYFCMNKMCSRYGLASIVFK